jgi:hypothetical protein
LIIAMGAAYARYNGQVRKTVGAGTHQPSRILVDPSAHGSICEHFVHADTLSE